jgi:type IV pilus assembly protein PilV
MRAENGFSMLEVLIAVVIFAIGLLGTAHLQIDGLRYTHGSYLRIQATALAYDIIDRMRANTDGLDAGYYDTIDSSAPPTDPACIDSGCNAQQLADHDKREWGSRFTASPAILPSAAGTVTRNGDIFTVTVSWVDMGSSGAQNQSLSLNFRM